MRNRIISAAIAVQICICLLISYFPQCFAADATINIKNAEEYFAFVQSCTLDTWSDGKTINLTADIDFSGINFKPVPTFCGTFNGNGYTFSGISYDLKGSYCGVFRYIGKGGLVSNLKVSATFLPGGTRSFIGGIAGENSGIIEGCSFSGSVKGENVVGGIAGSNTDNGSIISCDTTGSVSGENSTGGVAGKNSGFIQSCTNNAAVNTVYEEKKNTLSDIDADTGAIIESYKSLEEENEEESIFGHTDTGGIAGYSSGIIQGCVNNAAVGYKHIGYNVGGIAGRQSGYMLGCQNHGYIQGRKDTGGIVGQAEPYVLLNSSQKSLGDIRRELNSLNALVNAFISDADDFGTRTRTHLDGISEHTRAAADSAEALLKLGTDFADDNIAEINAQAAILSNTTDKLITVFDSLEDCGDNLSDALSGLSEALDEINTSLPDLDSELDSISSAMYDMSLASQDFDDAVKKARKASNFLYDAITLRNRNDIRNALNDLTLAIKDIAEAKQSIRKSAKKIEGILASRPESFDAIGINAKELAAQIKAIAENTGTIITALEAISKSIDTITVNTEIDYTSFRKAAQFAEEGFLDLEDSVNRVRNGLRKIRNTVTDLADKLSEYTGDDTESALNKLKSSISSMASAADDLTDAVADAKKIVTDLSDEGSLEFVKLGDDFKDTSGQLFDSLSGISDEIDNLCNVFTGEKDNIKGNLTAISNQFTLVMNLIVGEAEDLSSINRGLSDIFVDVSDDAVKTTKQGKVEACSNFAAVDADRNTGGIAGAVAIEYSKDPEDDLKKPDSLNFTYLSKAVLQECVNNGKITGKKDCTGGIAGLTEIGTVYQCENYADAESTSGSYVGGIVGKSDSAIRKSFSKATYNGQKYVGGIAGKGSVVTASYAIAGINGNEMTGAICGSVDSGASLYKNFYVDNGLGAIDGISYSGKAEQISFDDLKNTYGIPSRFIEFTVTFIADDNIIKTQEIKYGEDTAGIKYPNIPEKAGHFGKWEKPEAETIKENIDILCSYKPYITILSSVDKADDGKMALALAEGEFTDDARLHIKDSSKAPPAKLSGTIKVYEISLLNTDITDSERVNMRILNKDKDKITAWALQNGEWVKIKTSPKGKYSKFQITGNQATVCFCYERNVSVIIWLIIPVGIIVGFVFYITRKKHSQKPKSTAAAFS